MDIATKPKLSIVRSSDTVEATSIRSARADRRTAAKPPDSVALSDLVDEASLAARLGVSRATLQSWRYSGQGPAYVKVGRFVRYRDSDIEAFLERNAKGVR